MSKAAEHPERALRVSYLSAECLKPDPKNARRHSPKQIRQIAESVKSFGFNVPILVDADRNVVAGHGRLFAAKELGWTEVPVIQLDHLSDAQRRAFMIADNRLTETSAWDDRLLAEQLKELSLAELDFNLEAIGFDMPEIDLRILSLETPATRGDDPADSLPALLAERVSQAGDVWQLGRHRIICGSALNPQTYTNLMGADRAEMVFTDPPYNVKIDGHASGLGSVHHQDFVMASGEMDEAEFTEFLTRSCSLMTQFSVDGAIHFICIDWRHLRELLAAGKGTYTELKNICVWCKHNAGMGSLYRSQHELVLVFKHGHASHRNNVQLGGYGRHRSNVWNYRGANDFGRGTDEGNLAALHPTPKPVQMVADAILDCSARGDVVLDAFLGIGSTLIAAERVGRRCFGIEIDGGYVDITIRRWQTFTGDQARHVATGLSIDELAARRKAGHVSG